MNERLLRLGAIVRADFLIRFRRVSTLVVFLIFGFIAYIWIPDPATGRALLQVHEQRALYNSAAIGMGTAVLAATFIGLFGFYVVSNALRRDIVSRCGFVIASTTMRSSEYLVAKMIGNIVFLSAFTAAFMLSSMAMLLVRGEAPLKPWVFATQYALVVPSAIVFVSVIAVVFESISFLSGRLGDVVYFVLWFTSLGLTAALLASGHDPGLARCFDFSGLGFTIERLQAAVGTTEISIGASSFDSTLPIFVFDGLALDGPSLAGRAASLVTPLPLLAIAILAFHRFDPARVRGGGARGGGGWRARATAPFKPAARFVFAMSAAPAAAPGLLGAAWNDARMTIAAQPALLAVAAGLAIASAVVSPSALMRGVLPAAFGILGVALADIPCRDRRAGTLGMLYAAPRLQASYAWWKFLAAALVALALAGVPIARAALAHPASLGALLVGVGFVAAAATALGVVTSNAKTCVVAFLTFWYIVINDRGELAALDFAGFYASATPRVTILYAAGAASLLAVAQIAHAMRLRREN